MRWLDRISNPAAKASKMNDCPPDTRARKRPEAPYGTGLSEGPSGLGRRANTPEWFHSDLLKLIGRCGAGGGN